MPTIVLLRHARTPDPYVDAFERRGWPAVCRPVLAFDFPALEALEARLQAPASFAGLVATSPRAVEALGQALAQSEEDVREAWAAKQAFAVGPKTAAALRALGFRPEGQEAGRAEDLARHVAQVVGRAGRGEAEVPARPLLFLSGSRRREALPRGLRAAGVPFEELTVYRTRTRDTLDLPEAEWLAFFSPSGLEAVQNAGVEAEAYRRAAIGPTTAQALADAGLPAQAVAERPTPEALADAVVRAAS